MSTSETGSSVEFFHHPTWSEPWFHPELIQPKNERTRRWETQPWYRQTGRLASIFLRASRNKSWPWGYVIYRTVYTPESDAKWSKAMEIIDQTMHRAIDLASSRDRGEAGDDGYPERLIHEAYRNVVLCDEDRFNGASLEQIREHFNEWKEPSGLVEVHAAGMMTRFNFCLVVDEKALSSIADSVEPENWPADQDPKGYCVLVDPDYDRDDSYESLGYEGHMRVELRFLWSLYVHLDYLDLTTLCPSTLPGQIPLYDGFYGKAVNKDGDVL